MVNGQTLTLRVLANVYANSDNNTPIATGSVLMSVGASQVQGNILSFTGSSALP